MDEDGGMGEMGGHGMSMSFHTGVTETILFSWWKTDDVATLVGSAFGVFFITLLYELLKYYRDHLLRETKKTYQFKPACLQEQGDTQAQVQNAQKPTMFSTSHIIQTLLHMVQFIISYCLMLIFMTYNVWLCLAMVLGSAIGYFLLGHKMSNELDNPVSCH